MARARSRFRNGGARFAYYVLSAWLVITTLVGLRLGWLIPLALVLLVLSFVLALLASIGPLAPFVYPLI